MHVSRPVSTVPLLSCCLFIIDAVATASIFAIYSLTHIRAYTNTKKTKNKTLHLQKNGRINNTALQSFKLFLVSTSSSPSLPLLFSPLYPSSCSFVLSLFHFIWSLPLFLSDMLLTLYNFIFINLSGSLIYLRLSKIIKLK